MVNDTQRAPGTRPLTASLWRRTLENINTFIQFKVRQCQFQCESAGWGQLNRIKGLNRQNNLCFHFFNTAEGLSN